MHIIHWREAGITGNGSMAILRRVRDSWVLFAIEPSILEIPIWFNHTLRIGYSKEVERAHEEPSSH